MKCDSSLLFIAWEQLGHLEVPSPLCGSSSPSQPSCPLFFCAGTKNAYIYYLIKSRGGLEADVVAEEAEVDLVAEARQVLEVKRLPRRQRRRRRS